MDDNTVNSLIAYMLQVGAIDANTGRLTDKASTHYTYENGRFTADASNANSTRDAGGHDERAKRERKKAAYLQN